MRLLPAFLAFISLLAQPILAGPSLSKSPAPASRRPAPASFSGAFTVGLGGDYATLTAALADVNSRPLTGPISLLLTDSSYPAETFPLVLLPNAGSSATNTITIKPAPGIQPTLASSDLSDCAIVLLGADYVILDGSKAVDGTTRDLTITTQSTVGVVCLRTRADVDGATHNVIKNCQLVGRGTITNSTAAGIFAGGFGTNFTAVGRGNHFNTFQNNRISQVALGIVSLGASSFEKNAGTVISQNQIDAPAPQNVLRGGIYLGFEDGPLIDRNTVANIAGATFYAWGISLGLSSFTTYAGNGQEVTNATVTRNSVRTIRGGDTYGLAGLAAAAAGSGTNLFANNEVADVNANPVEGDIVAGIFIGGGAGSTRILGNSVSHTGSFAGGLFPTFALAVAGNNPVVEVRNNAFACTGSTGANQNRAIGLGYSVFSNFAASHNDLFVSGVGSAIGQTGNLSNASDAPAVLASLADWRAQTGESSTSFSADPLFNSTVNLQPGTGSPLLGAGTPVAVVSVDLRGNPRDPAHPSVGAYELAVDATGPVIGFTALVNTTSTASRSLSFTVADASGVPVSGPGLPVVYYRKGAAGAFQAAPAGSVRGQIYSAMLDYAPLGGVVVGDTIQYFIAAQDNSGNVSVSPASGASGFTANPPAAAAPPTNPASYRIGSAFAGTYTVGAGGNFSSLTNAGGAFQALNNAVLTGPVTLQIVSDLTGELGTVALDQAAEEGAGGYSITIKPAGAARTVAGTSSGARALLTLNGADRVVLDGSLNGGTDRSLTFTNTNSNAAAAVIWLQSAGTNGATQNVVRNLVLVGSSSGGTGFGLGSGSSAIGLTSGASGNHQNTFQNNLIRRVRYGIFSSGAGTGARNVGTVIRDNDLTASPPEQIGTGGIYAGAEDGILIARNRVANIDGVVTNPVFGITLGLVPVSSFDDFSGREVVGAVVEENEIDNVVRNADGTAFGIGVATVTTPGAAANTLRNNRVARVRSTRATPTDFVSGLLLGGGLGATLVYHNSVSMTGSGPNSSPSFAVFLAGQNPVAVLRNNVFANALVPTSGNTYAIGLLSSGAYSNLDSDYNLYYSAGTTARFAEVGGVQGSDRPSLAAWQAETGQDAHSLSLDPRFNSAADLRPAFGAPGLGAGVPLASVPADLLGVVRSATAPTIGCYEAPFDQTPPTIVYTPLGGTASTSNRLLTFTVTDASIVPTSGSGLPVLYFRKGNAGTFAASPAASLGGNTYQATFDYALLPGGSVQGGDLVQYFFAAQDGPGNVAVQPAAGAAGLTAFPPAAATAPSAPDSYQIVRLVSGGTINVGAGEAFTSLTNPGGVFDALNRSTLTGSLIVQVTSDLAGESGDVSLQAWAESGPGGYFVTLKPSGAARTITGSGSGSAVLRLQGADRFTVDGSLAGGTDRSLTLINPNPANNTAVIYLGSLGVGAGCADVTIQNSILRAGALGSSGNVSTYGIFAGDGTTNFGSSGSDHDRLTIRNNQIARATVGITIFGSSAGQIDDAVIVDNLIGDALVSESIGRTGLSLDQLNRATVSGNTIRNVVVTANVSLGHTPRGIILSRVLNSTVSRNTLTGIGGTPAAARGGRGIDVAAASPSSGLLIANNVISNLYGQRGTDLSAFSNVGVRIYADTGGVRIYHNSIFLGGGAGPDSNEATVSAALYAEDGASGLDVRNNIFATNLDNTSVTTDRTYAIATTATSGAVFTEIDANLYFVSGPAGMVGRLNGVDRPTLADWRQATGRDAASLAGDPLFFSPTDLHLSVPSLAANAGVPLPQVSVDVDGQPRSALRPDIGADELPPSADLAGLSLSAGLLVPAFAPATVTYTAGVGAATASLTVLATPADSNATLQARINGGAYMTVVPGSPSAPLALTAGNNPLEVLVTPEFGPAQTYFVQVSRAAAPPVAPALALTTTVGQAISVPEANLLSLASDPAGLALTFLSVSQPTGGAATGLVTHQTGQGLTFAPAAGFTGTDSFSYIIQNSAGTQAAGMVTITVTSFSARPVSLGRGPDGQFSATYAGVPNVRYRIEFTEALTAPFQPLLDGRGRPVVVTAGLDGTFTFTQAAATGELFFRARALP